MTRLIQASIILFSALALAAPAAAQQGASDKLVMAPLPTVVVWESAELTPTLQHDALKVEALAPLALQPNSQNVALMVVGGAGLIIGAVIGGDAGTIIMVAGGGVTLLGLWRYLR